jgi:hypothetical protein
MRRNRIPFAVAVAAARVCLGRLPSSRMLQRPSSMPAITLLSQHHCRLTPVNPVIASGATIQLGEAAQMEYAETNPINHPHQGACHVCDDTLEPIQVFNPGYRHDAEL